jgi:hypothetical protein
MGIKGSIFQLGNIINNFRKLENQHNLKQMAGGLGKNPSTFSAVAIKLSTRIILVGCILLAIVGVTQEIIELCEDI